MQKPNDNWAIRSCGTSQPIDSFYKQFGEGKWSLNKKGEQSTEIDGVEYFLSDNGKYVFTFGELEFNPNYKQPEKFLNK